LQEAGIILTEMEAEEQEQEEENTPASKKRKKEAKDMDDASVDELKVMLDEAIDVENYILAAKIRDEIKRREGSTEE
jgi:uncharacterized protein